MKKCSVKTIVRNKQKLRNYIVAWKENFFLGRM
jgi:hypothetical protein